MIYFNVCILDALRVSANNGSKKINKIWNNGIAGYAVVHDKNTARNVTVTNFIGQISHKLN